MSSGYFWTVFILSISWIILSCTDQPNQKEFPRVNKKLFGTLHDGHNVFKYTLLNKNGLQVQIIDYGAAIVSFLAPNREGKLADVVLGYDKLEDYVNDKSYFGAIVGRYGNRISKGIFFLDGQAYQLTINDGQNHLHGGVLGFNKVLWQTQEVSTEAGTALKLTYLSQDGEQGYPGTVTLHVTYTLNPENELLIDYEGMTDKATLLNPTNHTYFNLTGSSENTILNHELMIDADKFTPVDSGLITTGELAEVAGTPMDFRTPAAIGLHIADDYKQLRFGRGYDHNWVLNNYSGEVRKVASLYEPINGRLLEVFSDQPGLQFYSGNFLDGSVLGKGAVPYHFRTGLCLETQHFPDSPNKVHFPSVTLRPGEIYKQRTIYRFSVK